MNLKNCLLISVLLFASCITITRVKSRKIDDGYSSISNQEKKWISNYGNITQMNTSDTNRFEIMTVESLKEICKKSKYTFVIIWATWCPVCHSYFENGKLINKIDSLQKSNVNTILVCQNFNITYAQQLLKKWNYGSLSYIIDSDRYSSDETKKQDSFLKELTNKSFNSEGSVPNNILLNSKCELLFSKAGSKVSTSEIISNLK